MLEAAYYYGMLEHLTTAQCRNPPKQCSVLHLIIVTNLTPYPTLHAHAHVRVCTHTQMWVSMQLKFMFPVTKTLQWTVEIRTHLSHNLYLTSGESRACFTKWQEWQVTSYLVREWQVLLNTASRNTLLNLLPVIFSKTSVTMWQSR